MRALFWGGGGGPLVVTVPPSLLLFHSPPPSPSIVLVVLTLPHAPHGFVPLLGAHGWLYRGGPPGDPHAVGGDGRFSPSQL